MGSKLSSLSELSTLRLGLLTFVGAASLDALATIIVSAGLLAIPFISKVVALGIVTGLLEFCVVGIALLPKLRSFSTDLKSDLVSSRGFLVITILFLMMLVGGVELLAFRAVLPGSMEIVGAVIGITTYFLKFKTSSPISRNDLLITVLAIVTAVFLAVAGFSGAGNVLTTHLGVVSIAIMIASVTLIARNFGASESVITSLLTIAAIVFAISLLVGNGGAIWTAARILRVGGAVAAGAVIEIIAGISGIIAGIVILIEGIKKVSTLMKAQPQPTQ